MKCTIYTFLILFIQVGYIYCSDKSSNTHLTTGDESDEDDNYQVTENTGDSGHEEQPLLITQEPEQEEPLDLSTNTRHTIRPTQPEQQPIEPYQQQPQQQPLQQPIEPYGPQQPTYQPYQQYYQPQPQQPYYGPEQPIQQPQPSYPQHPPYRPYQPMPRYYYPGYPPYRPYHPMPRYYYPGYRRYGPYQPYTPPQPYYGPYPQPYYPEPQYQTYGPYQPQPTPVQPTPVQSTPETTSTPSTETTSTPSTIQPSKQEQTQSKKIPAHVQQKAGSKICYLVTLVKKNSHGKLVPMTDKDYKKTYADSAKIKFKVFANLEQVLCDGELAYTHVPGKPYPSLIIQKKRIKEFILKREDELVIVKKVNKKWKASVAKIPQNFQCFTKDDKNNDVLITLDQFHFDLGQFKSFKYTFKEGIKCHKIMVNGYLVWEKEDEGYPIAFSITCRQNVAIMFDKITLVCKRKAGGYKFSHSIPRVRSKDK